jgi:hypothetical protein
MALHIAARLHAWWHGLWRSTDAVETELLYERVAAQFARCGIVTEEDRSALAAIIADDAMARLGITPDHSRAEIVYGLVIRLFDYDDLFLLPVIDWRERRTIAEWWALRDALNRQRVLVENFDDNCKTLVDTITALLQPIYASCPALLDQATDSDGITVPTQLLQSIGNPGVVTEAMLVTILGDESAAAALLPHLRQSNGRQRPEAIGAKLPRWHPAVAAL